MSCSSVINKITGLGVANGASVTSSFENGESAGGSGVVIIKYWFQ
jgi:hypothetical protein